MRARVDDLKRRNHVAHRVQHVEERHARALQRAVQNEGQFHFHARHDEAVTRDLGAVGKQHVVQQRAVVGLVDL
ncbi:hypothetical protein D3C87_1543030 [compost metagenome]